MRRVGRNLLLFQQIELLLKELLSKTGIEGYLSEIPLKLTERAKAVQGKTFGQLAGLYTEEIVGPEGPEGSRPGDRREIYAKFSFKIELDSEALEQERALLDSLVLERNHLAHTFLTSWKPDSSKSTQEALKYLDAQRERAVPVRDRIAAMLKTLAEGHKEQAAYLMSEEGGRQLDLMLLQSSHLVQVLAHISQAAASTDGWTVLARAGQLVRELAPDSLNQAGKRFGHSSLKRLVVASQLFDVAEEPTTNGQTRTLYRLKAT